MSTQEVKNDIISLESKIAEKEKELDLALTNDVEFEHAKKLLHEIRRLRENLTLLSSKT